MKRLTADLKRFIDQKRENLEYGVLAALVLIALAAEAGLLGR